ncbi:MAG: tetratricopeptide repeat protein, partial [Chloroflexia bacterium]|nr:tetratricopeptide repeat protein [Chloroflexia bacterium]
ALDDLHWADEASLAMLIDLMEVTVQAPLMFCLVFRPKRDKGCWRLRDKADTAFHHRYTEISLAPLSPEDSLALLDTLLPGADFSPQTVAEILDKSAGNPFYLEEVVRSLMDSGAVEPVEGATEWRVTDRIAQISVPDSLQGAIISRIDRLTEDARQALQMAAVIGRRFQMDILNNLADAAQEVGSWMAQLERSDLIAPVDLTVEAAYVFPDALVHEVAYDNLLLQRRQEFHYRTGLVLEELLGERVQQEPELLAYHFSRSDDDERAIQYLRLAAQKAQQQYANETAIEYYERLLKIYKERGDTAGQAEALYQMGVVAYKWGDYGRARTFLGRAVSLYELAGDQAGMGWAVMYLGMVSFMEGNYSEALEQHGRALELAQGRQDLLQEGIHLTNLARVSLRLGEYDKAIEQLERSLVLKGQMDDLRGQGFSHFYIAMASIYLGRYPEAEQALQESLRFRQQVGDEREIGHCLYGQGLLALQRAQWDKAVDYFQQAYEMSARLDLKAETITNLSYLGQSYLAQGQLELAHQASARAMALLQEQRSVEEVQQVYLNHYRVLAALEDEAAGQFREMAYEAMMNQAYRIADEQERQIFLENVRVNQEIQALCQQEPCAEESAEQ